MMKTCKKCGFQHNKDKCPECHKAYMKQWHSEHKEHDEAYAKQYYHTTMKPQNKERYAKYREQYKVRQLRAYQKNPEKELEKGRRWKRANREHLREYDANRYATKTEYMKTKNKRWRQTNPKRRAENEARRRARIRENGYEKVNYAVIAERDGYICHICGLPVSEDALSFDHVIPLAKGGSHTANNIKVAHKRCNFRKKDRIINFQKGETHQ